MNNLLDEISLYFCLNNLIFVLMKYLLFTFFFVSLGSAYSQSNDRPSKSSLDKGQFGIGASIGTDFNGGSQISPRIQYFLANSFSLLADGQYIKSSTNHKYLGLGLAARYYILRQNKLSFFGQAGGTYGRVKYNPVELNNPTLPITGTERTTFQLNADVGAHYSLLTRLSIEATFGRSQVQKQYVIPSYNSWQSGIGINYYFR